MITREYTYNWSWPKEFMDNPTWHFISTTWSGLNDVLKTYVDGEQQRDYSVLGNPVLSISGGGRLGLRSKASIPIRFTSFNMWNRVLSDEEIKDQAKSCNGAIGNVKEWYDVWSVVQSQSSYYTKPTTCSAPRPPIPPVAESGRSAYHLESSGKPLFVKYKKRKSSIKDGSKVHH